MAIWKSIIDRLSKNDRNMAKYQAKKERGPVKAMFHITRNENVPNIEKTGLLTNPPGKINENSARDPFGTLGVQGGGVWVTDRPTAFPVYGSTVGGKGGGSEARRDALTTLKLEVPKDRLAQMDAVFNPYGHNMHLTTADRKNLFQPFNAWDNSRVGTTALLEDIPPEWIKPIGYVEENNKRLDLRSNPFLVDFNTTNPTHNKNVNRKATLSKADKKAVSGTTGHDYSQYKEGDTYDYEKSPARFVEDYLQHNKSIGERLPRQPQKPSAIDPNYVIARDRGGAVYNDRYNRAPTANDWNTQFQPYVPYGKSPVDVMENIKFPAGAISRGTGAIPPDVTVTTRNFNWNLYKKSLADFGSPRIATEAALPETILDWDNITYDPVWGYHPKEVNTGRYSRGGSKLVHGSIDRGGANRFFVDPDGDPYIVAAFDFYKDPLERARYEQEALEALNTALEDHPVPVNNLTPLPDNAPRSDIVRRLMRLQWLPENEW